MPQIGWFEILIIVVLSILIIGPKDFPIMIKRIGSWIATFKSYFADIQKDVLDIENSFEKEISTKKETSNLTDNIKKDE